MSYERQSNFPSSCLELLILSCKTHTSPYVSVSQTGFPRPLEKSNRGFPRNHELSGANVLVEWPSSQWALVFQKAILAEDFEDIGCVMVMPVRLATVIPSSLPRDHQKITNWTSQCSHTEGRPSFLCQWGSSRNRWRANTCQPALQGVRQTHSQAASTRGGSSAHKSDFTCGQTWLINVNILKPSRLCSHAF